MHALKSLTQIPNQTSSERGQSHQSFNFPENPNGSNSLPRTTSVNFTAEISSNGVKTLRTDRIGRPPLDEQHLAAD